MDKKFIFLKDTSANNQIDKTRDIYTKFLDLLRGDNLQEDVQVLRIADAGIYNKGVIAKVFPDNIVYANITEDDVKKIIETTIKQGKIIDNLLYKDEPKQLRLVLKNCGVINPESIEEYIANGGYEALGKVVKASTPKAVIEELKISGLRGRGGAGYPTWKKWEFAREIESDQKYIICNGDEGDPGAYMDRSVLEGDPHAVIEGMIIGGFTIGASKGFVYIRAEYPLAIERVQMAIEQAKANGYLGEKILGSNFNFDLEIRLGAGAFVCGEETALIASIEGRRGTPRPRPPYPSVKGLWNKPTVINNVETLATIAFIISKGGLWFSGIGTNESKGTKVFAVTGKVKNSGLVEVPMGTTLREIVFDICGGSYSGKKIKAIQTGGPSGGVIPEKFFDTPVSYENLVKLGSIMGSGGMIVMDEDDCMVDIAKFYLQFCVDESCGKCAPCRIGGFQIQNILQKISNGEGKSDDIAKLKRIGIAMQKASLCGLGQSAPNPVLSTLNYFEDEYKEHIINKVCPSHKCKSLVTYSIMQNKCKRCRLCFISCPVNAIGGSREKGFYVDLEKCIKCGKCMEVCKFDAISKQ